MTTIPAARSLPWRAVPGQGVPRRYSIRDAVAVLSERGAITESLTGIVIGVTYGAAPLYDVRLDATGEVLQHVSTEQIAPARPMPRGFRQGV